MNFRRLINDSKEGLKRKISSRRDNVVMSIEAFQKLSNKYFKQIKEGENLIINVEKEDKEIIIFILRWYYNLWIEIREEVIEVFYIFPEKFEIIKEVNYINHPHTPKTFNKGTKVYKTSSNYASCNWLNGIPLWDNKEEEITKELKPSCQVNYGFIKRLEM